MTARRGRPGLLTENQVTELRRRYRAGGVSFRELAGDVGRSLTTVVKAVRGETWADLDEPPVTDDVLNWWTEDDDAYLRGHASETDEAIGARLGRSVDAVKVRRSRLKVGRPTSDPPG